MIDAQGWFTWAEKQPGPTGKVWPETNAIKGVVMHSAVGSNQGVIDRVMGPDQVSVTGVISYEGVLTQFYPVTQSPWANGNHANNIAFLGFEHEGGVDTPATVSEPLTEQQIQADVRILQDLAAYKGVGVDYWQRPSSLIEHREIFATACPSDRIPWAEITRRLAPEPPAPAPPYVKGIRIDIANRNVTVNFSDGSSWPLIVDGGSAGVISINIQPPPGA